MKKNNIMRIDFEEHGIKKTALYNGDTTPEEFARDIVKGGLYSEEVVIMDRKQFETIFIDLIPKIEKKTTSLVDAGLSVRAYNCLMRHGIECLESLEGYTIDDFRKIRNFSQRCFNEVYQACKNHGIKLHVGRTNADDVRMLNIDELADLLMCPYNKSSDLDCDNKNCHDCCVEWLNQEVNDESK